MKTRHAMHVVRHPEDAVGHIGVKDSATFTKFGNQQMSIPGQISKLKSRTFLDLKPERVLARKAEVGKVTTLAGIKSKYQYVCSPDGQVSLTIYVLDVLVIGYMASLPLLLPHLYDHELGFV